MRILAVTSTFPRWEGDSVPPFVHRLSAGLADLGHDVHVLAPHTSGTASEEGFDGLTVHRFRYGPTRFERLCYEGGMTENIRRAPRLWSMLPGFLAAEYAAIARLSARHRFDIVHAHWVVPQGLVAAMPRAVRGAAVVVSAHGADVFASRGGLRRRLLTFAARQATTCTVNSAAMQAELLCKTGVSSTVIPMGVDIERFSGRMHQPSGGNRVLFVGRLVEKKGVPYLLEAMVRVRRSLPDTTLTIVGDGPDRRALELHSQDLGVNDIVRFVGPVPNEALPSYYASADVFVAPSIIGKNGDSEGLGVVLLEAAAAGVPVVASEVGGIPDIVVHEQTGLLAPPKDAGRLAEQITRVLRSPELGAQLSSNAAARIKDRFSWRSVVAQFDDLFVATAGG